MSDTLKIGDKLLITEEYNEWLNVSFDRTRGYYYGRQNNTLYFHKLGENATVTKIWTRQKRTINGKDLGTEDMIECKADNNIWRSEMPAALALELKAFYLAQ